MVDYMDLPSVDMIYKFHCKEKVLVDIGYLRYGYVQEDGKKKYTNKESKQVNEAKKPKENHKSIQLSAKDKILKFSVAPYIMYRVYVEKYLIHPTPTKELEEHDHKPDWYDLQSYYIYHQVKVHKTNACIIFIQALCKYLDEGKVTYAVEEAHLSELIHGHANIHFMKYLCTNAWRGGHNAPIHPVTGQRRELSKDP